MEGLEKKYDGSKKTEQDALLRWVKLQTCLTGGILALLVAAVVVLSVQVGNMMKLFQGIDIGQVNAIVLSLQKTAAELENVDVQTINQTVEALEGAAQNLAKADVQAINDGIEALTAAAENLKGLDIQEVNELIKSLEAVAKQMEKTTTTLAAIGRLFGN